MENKEFNKDFFPNIAIPPGESVRENMASLGMNQEELAVRLGITTKHLSNVLNANSPITYETALKLESVLGGSAQFWMNLETNYQLDKARLNKESMISKELAIIDEIPYSEMSDYGWVARTIVKQSQVQESREYFGVANLELIIPAFEISLNNQKGALKILDLSVIAWIRKAEVEGQKEKVCNFDRGKLKKIIPKLREIIIEEPNLYFESVKNLCANVGIAFVMIVGLSNTNICAATLRKKNKVIIAISKNNNKRDKVKTTLINELESLLNENTKEVHINFGEKVNVRI